ncbi:MAG TPA: TolC family protein [Candidatus Angelobacter sp.]|nr:TolC family protein [Candidatus Angelobacter sp.]
MKALSLLLFAATSICVYGQSQQPMEPASAPGSVTPLAVLIAEAQQNNPEIRLMAHSSMAAKQMAKSAGALPDTQFVLQHLSVGSPRPFAGYTNSDFAYIGLGAAQEFPGPGKRKLRQEAAGLQAQAAQAQSDAQGRTVVDQVKTAYYKLAYLQQTLTILLRDDKLLGEMEQIAESRYRVGKGNQQEVLKAQLQHTRILQEINAHHREVAGQQAEIKRLLARPQDSPDVVAESLRERALPPAPKELLRQAGENNPEVVARKAMAGRADKLVELSRREFRPDFGVQYMYQNTDRRFRDYYMATLTVTLPNRGRRQAELAQALEEQKAAGAAVDAESRKRAAETYEQYEIARLSTEQLKIYREGLMPQAEATLRAAMSAYQTNQQDFETLLSSFRDVLDIEEQYQKELSDHESALARIESLTGVTLP